jgi:macrodomain Ter protein organizer (MatP/YcbG family)
VPMNRWLLSQVVEVHASMRKRAEAEAAAAKKNKIDLEAELSQVRESHRRLENTLQMRDDALLLERERSKKLALDLAEMRQQVCSADPGATSMELCNLSGRT